MATRVPPSSRITTSAESAFGVSASARGVAVAVTPGNNGEPAPLPRPRLALRPRRRACPPSAQPLGRRADTTRGAATGGMISRSSGHGQRFPRSQGRSPQRTARPAQADRLHRQQGSPAKPALPVGPHTDGGASVTGSENKHSAWSGGSAPSQRPGAAGHASSPHRRRSLIRIGVRDLTPLPLRYFAAVPGL